MVAHYTDVRTKERRINPIHPLLSTTISVHEPIRLGPILVAENASQVFLAQVDEIPDTIHR